MDSSASPLEKLTLWIYENKKIFNSAQYIEVMQLIADAYKHNNNNDGKLIDAFDYARYRLHSENDNDDDDNDEEHWSGTDNIESSGSDVSDNESSYVGSYINHY